MKTLNQVVAATFQTLAETKHKGRRSQYEALVRSAIASDGMALDGRLMMHAQSLVRSHLDEMTDKHLTRLHDQIARKDQDTDNITREKMRQEVLFEISQIMAHHVCAEALRAR